MERWGVPVRRRHPDVEALLAAVEGPVGDLARRLRATVREEVPRVLEGIKWRVPFFFLEGPLCYISPARAHVTFGIARGTEVRDPWGLLSGTGRSPITRAVLRPDRPYPEPALRDWLRQAVALDGTPHEWDGAGAPPGRET